MRNIGVVGGAACAGLVPLFIKAFEHIAELNFVRSNRGWSGELEFELSFAWGDDQRFIERNFFVVDDHAFENNGSRGAVPVQRGWIDSRYALHGGEIEPAIFAAPAGGLKRAVTFAAFHSIFRPVDTTFQGFNRSVGVVIQLFFGDRENSLVGAHPQPS